MTLVRGCRYACHRLKFETEIFPEMRVFSIILAAGWPIWPLLLASIIAVALIIERLVALRRTQILPEGLLQRVVGEYRQSGVSDAMLVNLESQSPLGRVLAAGLRNVGSSRDIMRESVEETGGLVAHELERAGKLTRDLRALLPTALPDWPPGGAALFSSPFLRRHRRQTWHRRRARRRPTA